MEELIGGILLAVAEFLGEVLLQIAFQLLAEFGIQGVKHVFARRPDPVLAALGYAILGGVAGMLSLLVFPTHFIHTPLARMLNLALTPLTAGLFTMAVGAWRRRRQQELVRLDRFGYGVLFALAMALVRLFAARGT